MTLVSLLNSAIIQLYEFIGTVSPRRVLLSVSAHGFADVIRRKYDTPFSIKIAGTRGSDMILRIKCCAFDFSIHSENHTVVNASWGCEPFSLARISTIPS